MNNIRIPKMTALMTECWILLAALIFEVFWFSFVSLCKMQYSSVWMLASLWLSFKVWTFSLIFMSHLNTY